MNVLNKLLFSILLGSLLFSCQKQEGQIYYINIGISPIRSIDCDNLKLHPDKKQLILSNEENSKLVNLFSQLKPIQKSLDVDARVYGSVYDGSKKLDFCSGIGVIEINNNKYFVDDSLREYLLVLTTKKK
ncbi:hypothetical protein KRE47_10525 [Elizabethkingia meningoseptica]|uniref:hypothetical protein n=1 Tax=Elizabethkingia meningoseptica TaxID=238 RepID=UPI002010D579|nr:hypothetical protein [Elizabethkingia meningoseptica]EJK5329982.1 hypothetical protein [Elizabethkingia meningoseptica]MCL1675865.1 hypothetical protein [Elizabethkingia meningoseptica]MCL1686490.1 hypothetical protein [Elizabethkingia meningoseptica]MDE5468572.1 hypothetical protein [Elizabethkingia meningoseptica]MDE5475884.1 hypothetical protein [Elizabethkingia meningoseptica]